VDHLGTRRLSLCAGAEPTKARPRPERRLLMGLRPHRHHRSTTQEEHSMSKANAELIRRAYQAYAHGDLEAMLELVDSDLEWTYLDPALVHPTPQVCHGRQELEQVLRHWAEHGLRAELDEVIGSGALVMVGVRTPGVDAHHGRRGDDCAYSVFAVREGRIVALRDCRDRQEAFEVAGIQT
jgi:ketosteroid isomerase-like protein